MAVSFGIGYKDNTEKILTNFVVFRNRKMPELVRKYNNNLAFDAFKNSQNKIKTEFTIRNKWTSRGIRVQKARFSTNYNQMSSSIGSMALYMRKQELGGIIRPKKGDSVPIPTQDARISRNKAKTVKRSLRMSRIQFKRRKFKAKTRNQVIAAAINNAKREKDKYAYLPFLRSPGIYRIYQGKKKNSRIRMVWSLKNEQVKIKKRPWLWPSTKKTLNRRDRILLKSINVTIKGFRR